MNKGIFVAILCAFLASPTLADLTTVYDTTYGSGTSYSEWDLVSGLSWPDAGHPGTYSGTWGHGVDDVLDHYYTSWTRVDDDFDQLWLDQDGGVLVKAIYTSTSNLMLGYTLNETTGSPITYLAANVSGSGSLDAIGEQGSFDISNTDAFVWVLGGGSGPYYSSVALNNSVKGCNKDRMVTFKVDGFYNDPDNHASGSTLFADPTYVLGFEDQWSSDDDFQDFVVQVSRVAPVPVPAAVLLGFLGLSAAGIKLRKFA